MKDTITLDSILDEIEQVRELALSVDDYKTALTCTMSKAKLLGGGSLEKRQQRRENPSYLDKLDKMFEGNLLQSPLLRNNRIMKLSKIYASGSQNGSQNRPKKTNPLPILG